MQNERQLPCTVSKRELDHLRNVSLLQAVPVGKRFSVFVEIEQDLELLSRALRTIREQPLKSAPLPRHDLAEHRAWPPHTARAIA